MAPMTVPRMTWSRVRLATSGADDEYLAHLHNQPTKNHLPKATFFEVSKVRYIDMLRKGYASPSFAADSAEMMFRSCAGTCLLAYLPPVMDRVISSYNHP